MLIHSEKAISLWKTVRLASVLSNASHLRFWELSAWLCAWFLILVKEKWKFKVLQQLLAVECKRGLAGTRGRQGTKEPDPAACQARGLPWLTPWPSGVAERQAPVRKTQQTAPSCQARCSRGVRQQSDMEICRSQRLHEKPRAGRRHGRVGIWPLRLCASAQHPLNDDAQIPQATSGLGATLTRISWMAVGHFSHSPFFSVCYALWHIPPFGFYLAGAFSLHHLLPFYSAAPKNGKWKESSHIFSAHTKKKKKKKEQRTNPAACL